jgi:acetyltransferase-like isoleucine patch superfamily enzyme
VIARLNALRQIAVLRNRGFGVAWNTYLRLDPGASLEFGRACTVGRGTIVDLVATSEATGRLALGDDVHIGEYNNIRAGPAEIVFGSRVLLAQFVSVLATTHPIDLHGRVMRSGIDPRRRDVQIGDDCWLGAQSVVLPGVQLGDRTIVGAGAVVTRSFPPRTKLVGVPARPI